MEVGKAVYLYDTVEIIRMFRNILL